MIHSVFRKLYDEKIFCNFMDVVPELTGVLKPLNHSSAVMEASLAAVSGKRSP